MSIWHFSINLFGNELVQLAVGREDPPMPGAARESEPFGFSQVACHVETAPSAYWGIEEARTRQ